MSALIYNDDKLHIEKVNLENVAKKFGTPCYVYSKTMIESNWQSLCKAFETIPHQPCYAVKANSNITILKLLAQLNAGFDIVSIGELERVIAAGGDVQKIIFSGVGKTFSEIEAAIQRNIFCFNVESEQEIERINTIAKKCNKIVNISLRINPNVDPHTHSYISTGLKENKFGIEFTRVVPLCKQLSAFKALKLIGIGCHIGSQIIKLNPFLLALERIIDIYTQLKSANIQLEHINIGGGLGIQYQDEKVLSITEYANALIKKLDKLSITLILEPGRFVVANAGILLTRVLYLKHTSTHNFAIVDAGLNDFLRPALYHAWQNILPIKKRKEKLINYDIAGPVCESADFLGKNRQLSIETNDLLAIDCAGAYGFTMSSNYNSRPRPPEVLVSGKKMQLIRRREKICDMLALETSLKGL